MKFVRENVAPPSVERIDDICSPSQKSTSASPFGRVTGWTPGDPVWSAVRPALSGAATGADQVSPPSAEVWIEIRFVRKSLYAR